MADTLGLVGKTYYVRTFGCQMNLHDSERVSGLLESCGCIQVDGFDDADIAVFMTCCVRENADTRLYGQATSLISAPLPPSGKRVLAIGGCIAQRDGARLRDLVPNVDVVFGTSALAELPRLLSMAFESNERAAQVCTDENAIGFSTDLPIRRTTNYHAWVPIMSGCNNFCTYCIVPYVRGRERSRTMESVLSECEHLASEGVREICLLGQNVNSYGRDLYGTPRFDELLRMVGELGIERLRFTSSNPKDLSDSVIEAMATTPSVMPHLHLAVQSGSTRVLRAMNRSYSRQEYLDLVKRLRSAMPDLAISTDIIVGFPTEEEQDFEDTLSLVSEIGFDSAYTFIYSRREGTPAASMPCNTSREVIQERFERLASLVADLANKSNQRDVGELCEVLVEGASKRDQNVLVGHSKKNQTVHFDVPSGYTPEELRGRILDVRVDYARTWYLHGITEGEPR